MFDLEHRARPVLKWAGGKSGILPQLLEYFPKKFNRYIEPFLGGGAVLLALDSEVQAIGSDSNQALVNLYEVIRDEPNSLMKELDRLAEKYSELFYYSIRSSRPTRKIEGAARLLFLNKTCFNGLYRENAKGEFNVSFGKRVKCPALYERENLKHVSDLLRRTELICSDFEDVINKATKGDFVYCDPPYEPVSVTSSFRSYTPGKFSLADQERLRDCCVEAVNRGATVVISNSSASQIKSLFEGHSLSTVLARRAINSKGDSRGEISESVIQIRPKTKSKRIESRLQITA